MAESQQTSDYPSGLDTWVTLTDKEDLAEASDLNKIKAAIEAIQTELGLDPAGSAATLVARLAISIALDGAIQKNTSFPGSPVAGQLFFRTDEDILYRRNAANGSWVQIGGGHARLSTTEITAATDTGSITLEANKIYRVIYRFRSVSGNPTLSLRFNGSSGSEYRTGASTSTSLPITSSAMQGPNASTPGYSTGDFTIDTTTIGEFQAYVLGGSLVRDQAATDIVKYEIVGQWQKTSTPVTSFSIISSVASSLTGAVYVYEYVLG